MCCAGFDVDLGHVLCLFPMQITVICPEVPLSGHLDYNLKAHASIIV